MNARLVEASVSLGGIAAGSILASVSARPVSSILFGVCALVAVVESVRMVKTEGWLRILFLPIALYCAIFTVV